MRIYAVRKVSSVSVARGFHARVLFSFPLSLSLTRLSSLPLLLPLLSLQVEDEEDGCQRNGDSDEEDAA